MTLSCLTSCLKQNKIWILKEKTHRIRVHFFQIINATVIFEHGKLVIIVSFDSHHLARETKLLHRHHKQRDRLGIISRTLAKQMSPITGITYVRGIALKRRSAARRDTTRCTSRPLRNCLLGSLGRGPSIDEASSVTPIGRPNMLSTSLGPSLAC